MKYVEIDLGGCIADCGHCQFAHRHQKNPTNNIEDIPEYMVSSVNRFLKIAPGGEKYSLDFATKISKTRSSTLDILDEPNNTTGLDFSLEPTEDIGEQIKQLKNFLDLAKKIMPNLKTITIGFRRSYSILSEQKAAILQLLSWITKNWHNYDPLFIVSFGSNEVPEKQLDSVKEDVENFMKCLFLNENMNEEFLTDEMKDLLRDVLENENIGIHCQDTLIEKDVLKWEMQGCIKDNKEDKAVVVYPTIISDTGKGGGRIFDQTILIDSLDPKKGAQIPDRAHFSKGAVNIFHNTQLTNIDGVWVDYKRFNEILDRAEEIGYVSALMEHFEQIKKVKQ